MWFICAEHTKEIVFYNGIELKIKSTLAYLCNVAFMRYGISKVHCGKEAEIKECGRNKCSKKRTKDVKKAGSTPKSNSPHPFGAQSLSTGQTSRRSVGRLYVVLIMVFLL